MQTDTDEEKRLILLRSQHRDEGDTVFFFRTTSFRVKQTQMLLQWWAPCCSGQNQPRINTACFCFFLNSNKTIHLLPVESHLLGKKQQQKTKRNGGNHPIWILEAELAEGTVKSSVWVCLSEYFKWGIQTLITKDFFFFNLASCSNFKKLRGAEQSRDTAVC